MAQTRMPVTGPLRRAQFWSDHGNPTLLQDPYLLPLQLFPVINMVLLWKPSDTFVCMVWTISIHWWWHYEQKQIIPPKYVCTIDSSLLYLTTKWCWLPNISKCCGSLTLSLYPWFQYGRKQVISLLNLCNMDPSTLFHIGKWYWWLMGVIYDWCYQQNYSR